MNKVRYGNLPGPGDMEEEEERLPKDAPDHEPEDFEADTRSWDKWKESDFAYDPLSRKGFE